MNFRKTLLPLLLLVCITRAGAQDYSYRNDRQVVATDYNTCLQGVKDSIGNWVIPPQYEYIEHDYERYVVAAGGKYGLLARNGTILIPPQYDYLRACNSWYSSNLHNYYSVSLNGKNGIVDTGNHVIVPVRYMRVIPYFDTSFVARKTKRSYDFYNAQGTCFPCPWKSRAFPDHDAAHLYIMRHGLFRSRHGLVNDSGRVLLRRKYSGIEAYESDIIKVEKNGKYGFCSKAGVDIWPMVFTPYSHRDEYADWSYLVGREGLGPVKCNGKYGLITAKGDTVLPFAYDHIIPFDAGAPELWRVGVDSLVGIYDAKNGWLLKPACTEIYSVAAFRNEKDSSAVSLLVAQMNGKWGATTTSGQVVIPFECEDMLWHTNGQHVFLKGDSVLALCITTLEQSSSLSQIINPDQELIFWYEDAYTPAHSIIPADNRFPVFKGKDGVRSYYLPSLTTDSVYVDSTTRSASTGNYYGMKIPDSVLISSCFSVIPILKPRGDYARVDFYGLPEICDTDSSRHSTDFCVIHNNNNSSNVTGFSSQTAPYYITYDSDVVKNDGTILISGDTIARAQIEHHRNDGSVYFRAYNDDEQLNFIVDTNGKMTHPIIRRDIEEFCGNYTWVPAYDSKHKNSCYEVIDNRTGLPVLGNKMYSEEVYPIWDSITIVHSLNSGERIYNLNQRKYCATSYEEIIPLRMDGTLFGVKTCAQHIGVVNASGKTILDTIYTSLTCIDKQQDITSRGLRAEFFSTFYTGFVFYNATQAVLLDPVNTKTVPYTEAVPTIWRNAVYTDYKKPKPDNPADSAFRYFSSHQLISICMTAKDSALIQPWQIRCMTDSVYTIKRYESLTGFGYYHRCVYCFNRGGNFIGGSWSMYRPDDVRYLLSFRSDSLLCFSRVLHNFYSYPYTSKNTFSTAMLFKDGVHAMTLDSLFNPTTDWRNFIINTLITYVNTHQNIEGDCHNPAGIPDMLKNDFEISPDGLHLYPHGFEEKGAQLVLVISWKELDAYLRNDIRSRLPITQH